MLTTDHLSFTGDQPQKPPPTPPILVGTICLCLGFLLGLATASYALLTISHALNNH